MKLAPFLVSALLAAAVNTSGAATRDEATQLLAAALTEVKAKGLDEAAKTFTSSGNWNKGSLYIVVADFKGTMLAHAVVPAVVGKNLWEVKDANGKFIVQEQIKGSEANGGGTMTMRWTNPSTKKMDDAEVVYKRVPGQQVFVAAVWFN